MTWEHGLIMFFAGTTLTVIGFLIAFSVASRVIHKENKRKNRKYSSVEESLRNLNAKFGDTE
jgi:hypothetical protein|tara:strand:+ start:140 stop:325 length:186 start_codon:yes stop_codon:yes gene_type:complete